MTVGEKIYYINSSGYSATADDIIIHCMWEGGTTVQSEIIYTTYRVRMRTTWYTTNSKNKIK
jgi:hypothetical protein